MSQAQNDLAEREFEFGDKEFQFLAKLVYQRVGIVLKEHKRTMVYSRLVRRLRALKLTSFKAYCDFLQRPEGDAEMGDLVNAITTNLTAFFREPHHFDHLRDEVLMPIAKNPPADRRVRIWSCAASSGAEPYSIAMTVREVFGAANGWDIKILATDIDTNMLNTGERGIYEPHLVEKIPAKLREKYVRNLSDGRVEMKDSLKSLLSFKQLNLLSDFPFKGPMDVVFCRNVVIYFDKPTQKILFEKVANKMAPRGHLYIGHSENLFNVSDRFESLGRTVYRRKS